MTSSNESRNIITIYFVFHFRFGYCVLFFLFIELLFWSEMNKANNSGFITEKKENLLGHKFIVCFFSSSSINRLFSIHFLNSAYTRFVLSFVLFDVIVIKNPYPFSIHLVLFKRNGSV